MSQSKVMTAKEAIAAFLHDGDCLAMGGFSTNRRAYGLVREIIRQKKRDLYLESGAAGGDMDMLIGAGCVKAIMISYIANSGYTQVCRRFRDALESGNLLFEDFSLDVQTIAYHGAALGLPYMPVKNMLGTDLEEMWGISAEQRKEHPKLPPLKFIKQENPFVPGDMLCLVPAPSIDVAIIHVQKASPDGTCRIEGPQFQDIDIGIAAKHTIISCEELVPNEELRRESQRNSLPGLCVDAVVHMPRGAHPSQCFGYYDYDSKTMWEYDAASRTQEAFDAFTQKFVYNCADHGDYLNKIGAAQLLSLTVDQKYGYVPGLKRSKAAWKEAKTV